MATCSLGAPPHVHLNPALSEVIQHHMIWVEMNIIRGGEVDTDEGMEHHQEVEYCYGD